jgi:hypothetical protein
MAVFGVGPVATLIAVIVLAVFWDVAQLKLMHWWGSANAVPQNTLPPIRRSVAWCNWAVTYGAPVAIAATVCVMGMRQRMPLRWTLSSAAIILIFGSFHFVNATWSDIPHQSQIGVSYIGPGYSRDMVLRCFERLAVNLFILGLAYCAWLRNAHPLANSSPSEMSA